MEFINKFVHTKIYVSENVIKIARFLNFLMKDMK